MVTNPIDSRCRNSATVTVTVDRNLQRPEFTQDNYETSIPETEDNGKAVLTVVANDADRLVSCTCLFSFHIVSGLSHQTTIS